MVRIAGGKAKASNFGKTIQALEEEGQARQEKAMSPLATPYELLGGVVLVLVVAHGCAFLYWACGRRNIRRERPEVSYADLKRIHGRLTTHEKICRVALGNWEAAVEKPI